MSAAKYIDALEYIKMIPWFGPSTREYSIDELNGWVISVNCRVATNIKYIKNGGDTLSTTEEIKEMVQKAKQAAIYEIEIRQKVSKIKENGNWGECKKNKQSKDGKRNRKHQNNNKPNPCWIEGHDHDWKDFPKNPWNKNKDNDKDTNDKGSKDKVQKSKSKNDNSKKSKVNSTKSHHSGSPHPRVKFKADFMFSDDKAGDESVSHERAEALMTLTKSRDKAKLKIGSDPNPEVILTLLTEPGSAENMDFRALIDVHYRYAHEEIVVWLSEAQSSGRTQSQDMDYWCRYICHQDEIID